MQALLKLSGLIDTLNTAIGKASNWLVLVVVIISAGNAVMRFTINWSSNAYLEIQWYLFSAVFLLCAAYVLLKNQHVRIDVIAGHLSPRAQNWIDVFGIVVFLMPMAVMMARLSWPVFMNAWNSGEISNNPGGLVRWPVRLLLPAGFVLLILQGVSELIKRVAFLTGHAPNPLHREEGPSAEEELAEEIKKHHVAEEVVEMVEHAHEMIEDKEDRK